MVVPPLFFSLKRFSLLPFFSQRPSLFLQGKVCFDKELLAHTKSGKETLVRMGTSLGKVVTPSLTWKLLQEMNNCMMIGFIAKDGMSVLQNASCWRIDEPSKLQCKVIPCVRWRCVRGYDGEHEFFSACERSCMQSNAALFTFQHTMLRSKHIF